MNETQIWKQERPSWCPHTDCIFQRRVMDDLCGGRLPAPEPHDGDQNTHRFCLNGADKDGGVFDLRVNRSDLEWLRWVFDALDGRSTSWFSRRAHPASSDTLYSSDTPKSCERCAGRATTERSGEPR